MKEKTVKAYKPSKVKLDKKASMAAYLLTLIAAVLARTAQLQSNMNFKTGKYIDNSLGKNYTLWVLIIGFALIFAVMIFGKSRDKAIKSCILINPMRLRADRLNKKMSPKAGAVMFIMAGLMIFDIFMELSVITQRNKALSTKENPVSAFAGISILEWFIYICAIITIVTLISTGTNILKGEGFSKGNCVFLSFFAIWKLLEIFGMIANDHLIGAYSEKVYIMLTAMASGIFFLNAAKFFAGFEKKHTRFWLCISGYAASIFAAVSVVPRYVMYFTKIYSERDGLNSPALADVGIIFVTVAVVAVFWSTYVYRVMPKLNLNGRRRWNRSNATIKTEGMKSIDEK
ncbi:MAG: hypothetical protein K2K44_12495 [Oscillospiraceae bacterium]|nr:hypothetical protein [Oscillospiraceae bacterium]